MTYSQKYCLVSFQDPLEINTEFAMADWPLHVTLADVFAADITEDMERKLVELFSSEDSLVTTAGEETKLGDADVVLLDKNTEITNLHTRIIDFLEAHGAIFNNPDFTRSGFLPHCTIQKSGHLQHGDMLVIKTISLIDLYPQGDWQRRRVLQNFSLRDSAL